MQSNMERIKAQNGSCRGLLCPTCELRDLCHTDPASYNNVMELHAQHLAWIKELESDRP